MLIFDRFRKLKKADLSKENQENEATYYDSIGKCRITVFLIPQNSYLDNLLQIAKNSIDKLGIILYIGLNKPAESIIGIFKENKIDTKKILFVDAVTKGVKPNVSGRGIIYIATPKNLEQFNDELSQIIKKEKFECIIFDSLSTLLIYQDENRVVKFVHDLITKLIVSHSCGCFICLSEDMNTNLVKDISMFADSVIDLGKEEYGENLKSTDSIKKEAIIKLEKELSSIKEAYASKFLSETSYLTSKERIEKKLKRLYRGKLQR